MGMIILISSIEMLSDVAAPLTQSTQDILEHYWPGPITFILQKKETQSSLITGGRETIAVRWPDNEPLNELITQLNEPLFSTSANTHGAPNPMTVGDIEKAIQEGVDFSCDSNSSTLCQEPSTIVDLTSEPPILIRKGAVDW